MLKSDFIEDVFLEFFDTFSRKSVAIASQDQSACHSFYNAIYGGKGLTQAQANYIIKILEKHKNLSANVGFDYRPILTQPHKWKNAFRVIDYSKRVYVEKNDQGRIDVCLKFPYQLKKEFEEEFEGKNAETTSSQWDHDAKVRRVPLYDTNLIHIFDFVSKHGFEIDETFMIAMGEVEEIWQNQDDVVPYCYWDGGHIRLKNVSDDASNHFVNLRTDRLPSDLMLAKSMGIPYKPGNRIASDNLLYKIASSEENHFWIKNVQEFIDLCYHIDDRVAILLDPNSNEIEWVKDFVKTVNDMGHDITKVRVCFRQDKTIDDGFNQWIKDANVGGPVEGGNILIFKGKPAKWLFKETKHVTLLASNGLYPSPGPITRDWIDSHPCLIYVGDIKPTRSRNKKIVEL